jgi:hypothetical protein
LLAAGRRGGGFRGDVGFAQEAVGARHVVFHGLDGEAEAAGDLAVGEVLDLAEEKNLAAARREAEEDFLEAREFLAGGDDALDRGLVAQRGFERQCAGGIEALVAAAADFVEREAAGGREEQEARFAGAAVVDGGLDADEGVLRDVLRLRAIAEESREVGAQREHRRPVK